MDDHHLRAIILKLQDRLSDNDRKRLHFFLGNDVPRRIRDDPTLGGTLSLMESLFDQDKINGVDFTFLINAFDEIQCTDAVQLLREHMRRMQSDELNESTSSLALIMPSIIDQVLLDQDEDKNDMQIFINQKNTSRNNKKIIKSHNTNIDPVNITIGNPTTPFLQSKRNQIFSHLWNMHKCLVLIILILMIGLGIMTGFFIEKTSHFNQLTNELKELNIEKSTLLVKAGKKFGGKGGSYFYDSLTKNITYYHYLSGIIISISEKRHFLGSIQVLYSSYQNNRSFIESKVYGNDGWKPKKIESFILDKDERINKVQGKLINRTLIMRDASQIPATLIGEIQFFTTKGRVSPSHNQEDGVIFTEQFEGYTLGYIAGRSGLYIDQLQFFWYRTDAVQ